MYIPTLESLYRKLKNFRLKPDNAIELRKLIKYHVECHPSRKSDALTFCEYRFGDNWVWYDNGDADKVTFYFLNENDSTLFSLWV